MALGAAVVGSSGEQVGRLFDSHHQRLYRLARRMSSTAEDAQDLLQETFLRVVRTSASVPHGASNEEAWLVRIMVNVCRTRWHQRANRRRLDAFNTTKSEPSSSRSPEAALVARALVWQALSRLAPRRRAIVVMCELEGMPVPDTARQLGIAAVTVRWHLSRGRRELLQIITRIEGGRQ